VRSAHPGRYLTASIVLTLSVLGTFNYRGLAVDLATPLLGRVLGSEPAAPDLVLPLGISFYTFELISLSVNIYRRRLPCPQLIYFQFWVGPPRTDPARETAWRARSPRKLPREFRLARLVRCHDSRDLTSRR
jgi:hypothetical protein